MKKNRKFIAMLGLFTWLFSTISIAQVVAKDATIPVPNTNTPLNINIFLCIVAALLLIPIFTSGKSFLKSAKLGLKAKTTTKVLSVLGLLLFSQIANAAPAEVVPIISSNALSYIFISVIAIEILIIALMNIQTQSFLTSFFGEPVVETKKSSLNISKKFLSYWQKANNFVPIEKEKDLDTGHNYDGIRELDNVTPPWFKAAFILSIITAIIYLYTHLVSHSSLTQVQELQAELQKGEEEKTAYLSNQANNIDESNVVLLTGADIDAGKEIFIQKCVACHKENGASAPGGVGPNLTDDHWIHGGSIKSVFTSIKNGYPEKGMISWKDQISPKQMAQIASFIKSIKGTVKEGGKEPQGELYVEAYDATVLATKGMDSVKMK